MCMPQVWVNGKLFSLYNIHSNDQSNSWFDFPVVLPPDSKDIGLLTELLPADLSIVVKNFSSGTGTTSAGDLPGHRGLEGKIIGWEVSAGAGEVVRARVSFTHSGWKEVNGESLPLLYGKLARVATWSDVTPCDVGIPILGKVIIGMKLVDGFVKAYRTFEGRAYHSSHSMMPFL